MSRRLVLVGALVSALPVLLATAMTPGYDPRRETVSRLASAGQPYAGLVRTAMVVTGVVVVAAAWRPGALVSRGRCLLRALITGAGAATVVAGVVAKGPPGGPASTASSVHVGAAVLGVLCIVAAMVLVAVCGGSRSARRASALAALVSGGAGAAFPLFWGTLLYGVLERVVVVAAGAWLLLVQGRSQR